MARRFIKPPVPAPYLAELPQLESDCDGRPTAEQIAEARRVVKRLRQVIRKARERWEAENGVIIEPEAAGILSLRELLRELHQHYTRDP